MRILSLLALSCAVILTGCAGGDTERTYVSYSPFTCRAVEYTCPQGQAAFRGTLTCGCETTTAPDVPETRTLDNIVRRYISSHVIAKVRADATRFSDFIYLDSSEEGKMLRYEVFVGVREYYLIDEQLHASDIVYVPLVLDIEQTGRSYIVRGHEQLDLAAADAAQRVPAAFSKDAADWLLDNAKVKEGSDRIATQLESMGTLYYGRPLTDTPAK